MSHPALALLRLLTNKAVMMDQALEAAAAWGAIERWIEVPGVSLADEPAGIDDWMKRWAA